MNVEISRNELAGALSALGKLVCRTSPVEVYRSLRIEGKENKIVFQTAGLDEAITYTVPVEGGAEFCVFVNFDNFRTVAKFSRNKSLVVEYEQGKFAVDHCLLPTVNVEWPNVPMPTTDAVTTELPENFVGALATAAPIVNRHEPRRVLQGIHICRDGVVVTNGKELLHIDLPLGLDALTLPFPHALLATKCTEGGTLATWTEDNKRLFSVTLGNWTWTGTVLPGDYPNWRRVIPDTAELNHVVTLDADPANQLAIFLRSVPDDPPNNPVTLSMSDGVLNVAAGEMRTGIRAEFPMDWGDFAITVNKDILSRLLSEGHSCLSFGTASGPFLATGGIGRYIAMPIACPPNPQVQPVQPKQEENMNEMQTNVVTTPFVPSAAPKLEPETPVNPLDDLASAVDDFKSRLRAMFDESTLLSRKVKEVALVQKQKERDFVLARRAIERIRMAI